MTLLNPTVLTIDLGDVPFPSIPTLPPPHSSDTQFDVLLRLDSWNGPGISEVDFNNLFVRCQCGMYMTRRVHGSHVCVRALASTTNVIDLTNE
jgi:hypothetical protein